MNMRGLHSFLIVLVLLLSSSRAEEKNKWSLGGLTKLLKNCSPNSSKESSEKNDFVNILRHCMQRRALVAMDAILADDVIPVIEGIELIRYKKNSTNLTHKQQIDDKRAMENKESGKTWGAIVFGRLARIFRTHVLKIDVDQLSNFIGASNETNTFLDSTDDVVQGRRRRHRRRHQMMPMLMMGLLVMGSVLIPMGFQFLAVLGGKALILAKLALMLSSIQGLKKIATNGVNYGLYHSPEGWHERSHQEIPTGNMEIPYQIYPSHSHP